MPLGGVPGAGHFKSESVVVAFLDDLRIGGVAFDLAFDFYVTIAVFVAEEEAVIAQVVFDGQLCLPVRGRLTGFIHWVPVHTPLCVVYKDIEI